jgi:Domain of unknown function (DUF4169)
MGETVNLRQWKKRRARTEAEAGAAQNRAAHGLPKALKQEMKSVAAKSTAFLDGRKLEPKRPS